MVMGVWTTGGCRPLPIMDETMKNRPRSGRDRPKPVLRTCDDRLLEAATRETLLRTVRYAGSPYHKRNPGDFGLTPPSAPRQNATLCDDVGVSRRATALGLLQGGIRQGLISQQTRNDYPVRIWSVRSSDGMVFEARLENEEQGEYHGYPLQVASPEREVVLDYLRRTSDV